MIQASILDDAREFLDAHIVAKPEQIDAMTLIAAATHAVRYGVTFPRVLFTSLQPESGKTHAMMVTLSLSSNPLDTSGTSYALNSALMTASNESEKPVPTLYRDEISDVFGQSGLSGSNNPIAEILRKGYKRGATRKASVNRVATEYSIFTPFLMTGLRTAVPNDIRTRCIILLMEAGKPRRYYDVREAEPFAKVLSEALAGAVKNARPEIEKFRARGLHPKLVNRKLEIWEPLMAVAYALGGQRWLNRAVAAFAALALDESETVPLSPRERIIRDVAAIAEASGEQFVGGLQICDELMRSDDPLYTGRSAASLACLVRDALPVESEQRTYNGQRMRGYVASELISAWASIRPDNADDVEVPEEVNPFDVDPEPEPEPDSYAAETVNPFEADTPQRTAPHPTTTAPANRALLQARS